MAKADETCAYCGVPVLKRRHSIHRDGFGLGPEVPLCDACGGEGGPSCEKIWAKLSARLQAERRAEADARIEAMLVQGNDAWFSDDGLYRYGLSRRLDASKQMSLLEPRVDDVVKVVLFMMLNPSEAGKTKPDPTSERCVDFGNRWRFTRLLIANMYGWVSPHPSELADCADPVGPLNDVAIRAAVARADLIVCAWGARPPRLDLQSRVKQVFAMLPRELMCLEINDDGSPSHPLYLKATLQPRAYITNNLSQVSR